MPPDIGRTVRPELPAAPDGPPALRYGFRLVGSFGVWRGGRPLADRDLGSRQGRTLLKLLLLNPDEAVGLDRIREVLWGDDPPANPERSVASLVSRLRGLLGAATIEGASGTYLLRTGPHLDIDLVTAERLGREARGRLSGDAPALARTAVERALELVGTGTVLTDEPDADWAEPARARLVTLRRELRRSGWEAASALGDFELAARFAEAALHEAPFDEEAARAAMSAHQWRGDPVTGLRVYEAVRGALAEELGVDPAPATRRLHLALLREEPPEAPAPAPTPRQPERHPGSPVPPARPRSGFVGRDEELTTLQQAWVEATEGRAQLILVAGEAGIGKTRLAEELAATVEETGGRSIHARCYEAERSLFLGPITEVLTSLVVTTPPERLHEALSGHAGPLSELVPEIADILGPQRHERSTGEVERRRIFQAVVLALRRMTVSQPLLLVLDDLHLAGSSTLELLHFLCRRVGAARLLIVATIRVEEGGETLLELGPVAQRLDVGPLTEAAVSALVQHHGASRFEQRIRTASRGHTLSVVEILEALAEVDADVEEPPIPASLRSMVLRRVGRAGQDVEELLRAAATLGSTFEPTVLARLLELSTADVARRCERAVTSRLVVADGARFAFSNDLMQEIVYASTPEPTRIALHDRAAGLLDGRPEAVAHHASAAGDWPRALAAWTEAADLAARRWANRDADRLLTHAIVAGEAADDPVGIARAKLARAGVREALADYAGALEDLEAAADLARASGRADLEAAALRALGGDVLVGLGRPSTDCLPYLEVGLDVAERARLGALEVELLGRIAVIWTNRARFDLAAEAASRALRRGRELGDARSIALALDAVKNAHAYMGDLDRLQRVLPELEGILRPAGDLWLLQWCVFESSIPALAHARWDAAMVAIQRAVALSERTGHPWRGLFLAHRSWLHRARGDYGRAIADAQAGTATEVSAGHPWWTAFSYAMLGWVLSDVGEQQRAIDTLTAGVSAAERAGMETYLIRCESHLALAHWRNEDRSEAERHLARAEELLDAVTTPPGQAFLHGAHAYAAAARVHLGRGDSAAAMRLLEVVRGPAEAVGWHEIIATDRIVRGWCRIDEGAPAAARTLLEEGVDVADRVGLAPLAWEGHVALARAATLAGDRSTRAHHAAEASRRLDAIAASLEEPSRRDALRRSATRLLDTGVEEPGR